MTLFDNNTERVGPVARWAVLLTCVAVVHLFSLLICPSLLLRGVNAGQVIVWAIGYAAVVSVAAAATAGVAFFFLGSGHSIRTEDAALALAISGVWLAPVAVFFLNGSIWSIATAATVACLLGASFRAWRATEPNDYASAGPFLVAGSTGTKQRVKCFSAALVIQSGITAGVGGHIVAGSYMIAFGAFLVSLWMPPAAKRQSVSRATAGACLVIAITAGALLFFSHPQNASASTQHQESPEEGRNSGADDLYSGFILIPEPQPHTTIVPPIPAMRRNLFRTATAQPLSIPFSGEYWIYHWPLRRPPKNSVTARGTPSSFKFTATAGTPLMMQARQNFGKLIDIDCCSRFDVAISNTDPLPGTVAMELRLVNTIAESKPSQSLGQVTIMSALPALVSGKAEPIREILKFEVPAASRINEFDEIVVIFHLRPPRQSRSANIAIERFYLVPSGQ